MVYLLYGEERYLLENKIKRIKKGINKYTFVPNA